MLDNLREDAGMDFGDDEELPDFLDDGEDEKAAKATPDPFEFLNPIRKMTPVQRFVLSALIFLMVCLIGAMLLLVTGAFQVF